MRFLTGTRLVVAAMMSVAVAAAIYFDVYGQLPLVGIVEIPVLVETATAKTQVADVKSKVRSGADASEYVVIDGQRFAVPVPWLGHRIEPVAEAKNLDFAMLPLALSFARRKVYVTTPTRDAFVKMAAAAAADGVELIADSGYRSVGYQSQIYRRKMAEGDGFYHIARGVAPPGYSEHMLGTAIDMVPSKWTFSGTPAEEWLLKNGTKFAFVQSYPQKSERGFTWEPWHWRYVADL